MIKNSKLMFVALITASGWMSGAVAATDTAKNSAEKTIAELYLKNCSVCHGEKGDGQSRSSSGMWPKPRDFTTAEAAMELSRDRMIESVTNGRPGTAMVAHKGRLTEKQIASLVDYIRSNFMIVPREGKSGLPGAVSLGEKIYTKNCSVCHGDNGNTAYWAKNGLNPPPRDFTSPEAMSNLTRKRMIHSVTTGRPGTGMMPFSKRLSKDEIAAVVRFIRFKFMGLDPDKDTGGTPLSQMAKGAHDKIVKNESVSPHTGSIPGVDMPLSMEKPKTAEPQQASQDSNMQEPPQFMGMPSGMGAGHEINVDMTAAIPNNLKADMKWGREFYMKNCFTCHGVKGDGQGPRAYFNRPPPRNFTSSASRQILNRPRIYNSITNGRVGTVMPAWGKVLNEQQIANLTEFVFQSFILGKGILDKGVQDKDAGVPEKSSQGMSDKKKAS